MQEAFVTSALPFLISIVLPASSIFVFSDKGSSYNTLLFCFIITFSPSLVKKNNIIPKIAATSKTVAVIIISPRFIGRHLPYKKYILKQYSTSLQKLKVWYNKLMKKSFSVCLILLLLSLCGCDRNTEISDTRFALDTVVTITADCDLQTLDGAFSECSNFEKLLSRTVENSDVYKLNNSEGFTEITSHTLSIIERSLYFSEISGGKFDITVCPVSMLWDFENQVVPSKNEIAEALKNVDYESIEIEEHKVNLNGKKIDLGGIAKGYIADYLVGYFADYGVPCGIINLGGNVVVFGKEYRVGIKKPFSEDIAAVLLLKDKSAVTSGIYERYIEKDGEFYHHIIDTETGFGVENELASVTVVGDSSLDCDALSTVCMLMGKEKGLEIIENTPDTEAVFISRDQKITLSSGLAQKNDEIYFK